MNPKKEQIAPEVFELYNQFVHNRLTRKDFMQKLSLYAVGGMTVPALMSFLLPNYQDTLQVREDDPRLRSTWIRYASPKGAGEMNALLCQPSAPDREQLGTVIVVHENRGLNPYIRDVARRLAVAGFVALAPDALSPLGGYPGDDDKGREMQAKRDRFEMLEDFIAAADFLKGLPQVNGRIGVVGFCFGGWISNMMAVRVPDLAAAVAFYGGQAPSEEVPKIQAPLLLHYAEMDARVNEGWPAYEEALKAAGKPYEMHMYPGTNHGFHNDSTPRYDVEAAKLAWERSLKFFRKHLEVSA